MSNENASTSASARSQLKKIPPIPVRRRSCVDDDGNNNNNDNSSNGKDKSKTDAEPVLQPSVLGLNHIKTRSSVSPSSKQGKSVPWSRSRLSENQFAPNNLHFESPYVQALLHLACGRRMGTCDVKSFSHELNSKGVRPFPVRKSRGFGHNKEIMVAVRAKFNRLKEEVDTDLGIFAGDLVGVLEKSLESNPEWKETLEDLLITARTCADMPPDEFWVKCEGIVQNLDDCRQEVPMGALRQAYTRLLFILTRCTRLVQFQKESDYEENRISGHHHQHSDLGVYSQHISEISQQDFSPPLKKDECKMVVNQDPDSSLSNNLNEKKRNISFEKDQDNLTLEGEADQHTNIGNDGVDVSTTKSSFSTAGIYRMSSWKRLPSSGKRNRKDLPVLDIHSKNKPDNMGSRDDKNVYGSTENLDTTFCCMEHSDASSNAQGVNWTIWNYHHYLTNENLMICRICEVEIPIVHVEEHSRICTISDRCDLKGLTVNERLGRIAETLEKILEYWTLKSIDCPVPIITGGFTPSGQGNLEETLFKQTSVHRQYSDDMLNVVPEADIAFAVGGLNILHGISYGAPLTPGIGSRASTPGTLTPRSPLLTPRTSQIELLLCGRKDVIELENFDQISKLMNIARSVANINNYDYSTLEVMLNCLGDLKQSIQDRKVDGLIIETFGRRIEKLLQEKYAHICRQIKDEKDSSNHVENEEDSSEEDTFHSLHSSPNNHCSKERTSIEDFEILKPISRGAFGRVFLARKRATGDVFAIKVLKKADMIRKNAVESILAERNILISVRNPFVVRFFYSFTCRENLYLVMEYLNGGDLYSLLRNLGCLDEDMARMYIAEVVLALEYLHSLNVIHRDLKPDNLLIGQDGHVKLTDFGLSKVGLINSTDDFSGPSVRGNGFLDDEKYRNQLPTKRERRQKHLVVGTPDYLAPEILLGMGHGTTADWWSVGVILYELLVGIPPFNAEHPQQIFANIMNKDIPWPNIPEEISCEAYDLIDKLLTQNPLQRLGATGANEVKDHPFFKNVNWDTLAKQKAMFIPSAEPQDTSYFMSRYIWSPEDENVCGGSDFYGIGQTCSSGCSSSCSNMSNEDGDECGTLADFTVPSVERYSFSDFSFKNLSQLAFMNYDVVVKSNKEPQEASRSVE